MKKLHLTLSVLTILVAACSPSQLIPPNPTAFVPAALPADTSQIPAVAASAAAPASTLPPAPTFTAVAMTSLQSTQAATGSPIVVSSGTALTGTVTPLIMLATSTSQMSPTPQGPVFSSVTTSGFQILWGDACIANSLIFTAQITTGYNVNSVLLFTRLQSQDGKATTRWNKAISLHNDGFGTFSYDVSLDTIKYYEDFNTAWIQYQLVAYNLQQNEVGRTQVYPSNLTISRCQ